MSIEEKKGQCVYEFLRVINEAKPRFFVFENVTGLLSSAIKHVSFYERMKMKEEEISPEERLGSAFEMILSEFKNTNYSLNWGIVNSADYGAPQKRKRLIILGSREGKKILLPPQTHGNPKNLDVICGQKNPWVTIKEAFKGLNESEPEYIPFPKWGKYMRYIPQGGNWRDLPEELKKEAMLGAFYSQGGRTGFYRRLSWDEPSPTLVTSPVFKGTVLAHPEDNRPLSVKEYARIQGFPDEWVFIDSTSAKYRIIGEAVPIPLSRALAKQILKEIKKEEIISEKV